MSTLAHAPKNPKDRVASAAQFLVLPRCLLFSVTALVIAFTATTAIANQSRGTTMTGVVQAVDHSTRWITLAQDGGPVRQFVYSSWTQFWHHKAEELPAHLMPGMRVQIQLHRPFIGPDFVHHIMLIAQPQTVPPTLKIE